MRRHVAGTFQQRQTCLVNMIGGNGFVHAAQHKIIGAQFLGSHGCGDLREQAVFVQIHALA